MKHLNGLGALFKQAHGQWRADARMCWGGTDCGVPSRLPWLWPVRKFPKRDAIIASALAVVTFDFRAGPTTPVAAMGAIWESCRR